LSAGQTFTVYFPAPGNFKLVCLVHPDMTGAIHVESAAAKLPYDQSFYDREGRRQATTLIADATSLKGVGDSETASSVNAGISAIVSTGGGTQTAMLARFLQANTVVRVGDTVEWVNRDASLPHTITFGTEPVDPRPPSTNVLVDADGARHATIGAPGGSVNSGIMPPTPQDRPGLAQAPIAATRFRVTFTAPGTFHYICSLHDNLGMQGTVIVQP
jgi:plastocyanin